MTNNKFNLIGFDFTTHRDPAKYKTCVFHHSILIKSKEDPNLLLCRECGLSYQERDTGIEERIDSMFGPGSNKPAIITAKKKKKYYDDLGNEINDETLIQDIQRGMHVIRYEETKSGEEYHIVHK